MGLLTSKRGLVEWLLQRISSVIMLISLLVFSGFFLLTSNLNFEQWHHFFYRPVIVVIFFLAIASVIMHLWVGLWTIITDYIKSFSLQTLLIAFVISYLLLLLIITTFFTIYFH